MLLTDWWALMGGPKGIEHVMLGSGVLDSSLARIPVSHFDSLGYNLCSAHDKAWIYEDILRKGLIPDSWCIVFHLAGNQHRGWKIAIMKQAPTYVRFEYESTWFHFTKPLIIVRPKDRTGVFENAMALVLVANTGRHDPPRLYGLATHY